MSRGLVAEIDLSALKANFKRIAQLSMGAKVCAVVKANAYGHGMERVAKALTDADMFAVTSLEEGLKLRSHNITQSILLLEGVFGQADLKIALENKFHLVIHCFEQLELLNFTVERDPIKNSDYSLNIWLKLDSGMGRLGFGPEQYKQAYQGLIKNNTLAEKLKELVMMTHFACADQPGHEKNIQQLSCYNNVLNEIKTDVTVPWAGQMGKSVANSGALFHNQSLTFDWVRPGISLYGASPLVDVKPDALGLTPVMTLKSRIIALKWLSQGESVGYGAAYVAQHSMRIAILAVGYGDGYPRTMRTGTPVLVNHSRAQLIGRVSMDMVAVDVSHLPEVALGDEVVLWGRDLLAEDVAQCANTISYELFCNIAQRVPLSYVNDQRDGDE